jgi:hypothetical protein
VSSPSKPNPQSADGASYALGYSGGEHERLIRQATRFAPYTEHQRFPLHSALLQSVRQALMKSGANVEMGPDLYRLYQAAGLHAPSMHLEQALGVDAEFISIVAGLILGMEALARQNAVPLDALGELRTLPERIHAEIEAANAVASLVALVGAWSRVRPIMARTVDRA